MSGPPGLGLEGTGELLGAFTEFIRRKFGCVASGLATNWIVDSAASEHFVNVDSPTLVPGTEKRIEDNISTAKGDISIASSKDVMAPGLGRLHGARKLEDGPNLVCLYKLVVEDGYDFEWHHKDGANPLLKSSNGERVPLSVDERVLQLDTGTAFCAVLEEFFEDITEGFFAQQAQELQNAPQPQGLKGQKNFGGPSYAWSKEMKGHLLAHLPSLEPACPVCPLGR